MNALIPYLLIGIFSLAVLLVVKPTLKNLRTRIDFFQGYLRAVIDNISDGVIATNSIGKIIGVNKRVENETGLKRETLLTQYFWEIYPPTKDLNFRESLERILKGENPIRNGEVRYLPPIVKDEAILNIDTLPLKNPKGEILGTVSLIEYATEKIKLTRDLERTHQELGQVREQILHADKLATIGSLASGVAHDINNPLTGALGFVATALHTSKDDNPQYERLKGIERAVRHCQEVVLNYLNFSRKSTHEKKALDINEVIRATLPLVSYKMKYHGVKLDLRLDFVPLVITGDLNQLQQVFINFITNSCDAMATGGTLTIKTDRILNCAKITFSDTGCGIPFENLSQLFNPFFTTKEEGTGLGLAVSSRIIKEHNGSISVKSKVGEGTTFEIIFPLRRSYGSKIEEATG